MDDGLKQAEDLLNSGYKDPACVIAGVCLETTIKELCNNPGMDGVLVGRESLVPHEFLKIAEIINK